MRGDMFFVSFGCWYLVEAYEHVTCVTFEQMFG